VIWAGIFKFSGGKKNWQKIKLQKKDILPDSDS